MRRGGSIAGLNCQCFGFKYAVGLRGWIFATAFIPAEKWIVGEVSTRFKVCIIVLILLQTNRSLSFGVQPTAQASKANLPPPCTNVISEEMT